MIGGTSFLCKRPSQSKPWNHLQQNHNIVIHGEKHPHTLIICLILFELNITKIHVYCLNPRSIALKKANIRNSIFWHQKLFLKVVHTYNGYQCLPLLFVRFAVNYIRDARKEGDALHVYSGTQYVTIVVLSMNVTISITHLMKIF